MRGRNKPKGDKTINDQNNTGKNILGVLLAAIAAVICVAIDELLKEERP